VDASPESALTWSKRALRLAPTPGYLICDQIIEKSFGSAERGTSGAIRFNPDPSKDADWMKGKISDFLKS